MQNKSAVDISRMLCDARRKLLRHSKDCFSIFGFNKMTEAMQKSKFMKYGEPVLLAATIIIKHFSIITTVSFFILTKGGLWRKA